MLLPSKINPAQMPVATALNHPTQARGTIGQIVGTYALLTILWPDGALELVTPGTVERAISLDVEAVRAALSTAVAA